MFRLHPHAHWVYTNFTKQMSFVGRRRSLAFTGQRSSLLGHRPSFAFFVEPCGQLKIWKKTVCGFCSALGARQCWTKYCLQFCRSLLARTFWKWPMLNPIQGVQAQPWNGSWHPKLDSNHFEFLKGWLIPSLVPYRSSLVRHRASFVASRVRLGSRRCGGSLVDRHLVTRLSLGGPWVPLVDLLETL